VNVRGSKAFVTGANRGIGRELVKALLDAGAAKVYAAARDVASFGDTNGMDMSKVVHVELDITVNRAKHVSPLPDRSLGEQRLVG